MKLIDPLHATEKTEELLLCPKGFYTCSKNVGIKDDTLDFTVISSDAPATAAAMFTQSRFSGAPIPIGKENVADGKLQAFVINSKNANVATGEQGIANVKEILRLVGEELDIPPNDILPSSTGVIGRQLPMGKIHRSISGLRHEFKEGGLENAAKAIMTTDSHPKIRVCKVGNTTLVGMAKGSGMIEPNMATMLSYFVTDAKISSHILQNMLKEAVNLSFNMLSVDTDTSTSDTVAIMANGKAGNVNLQHFKEALTNMAIELAKEIAKDGEGATKLIEVVIEDAASFDQAKRVGKEIVNSPLVKTAIYGTDPNWGRVAMAIGKCEEQAEISPEKVSISFGNITIFNGQDLSSEENLKKLENYLQKSEVTIRVSLGIGIETATVWGCDLSYEYVRINGEYTT